MTTEGLTTQEQDLIDRWVDSVLEAHPLSRDELEHLEEFMTGMHVSASDLWNSDWPGFHARTSLA